MDELDPAQHADADPTATPPAAPPAEGAEGTFDVKKEVETLKMAIEEVGGRLARIEETLDSLAEEEDAEAPAEETPADTATPADIAQHEGKDGKTEEETGAEEKEKEKAEHSKGMAKMKAQHAKEIAALKTVVDSQGKELETFRAKFAKLEESGQRRTVQSTGATGTDTNEMTDTLAALGI